jgi:membrane-associated phospholipid phosphatase
MDSILAFGISFIAAFQAWGAWPILPMQFFSFLGSEEFFLLVLPALYWSIDARLGLRVGVILLLSGSINDIFKLSMRGPRPYWFSPEVKAFSAETSFGVPSGHAQVASGVWGMLASQAKRPWAWAAAIFIILMIGLSRLYLGVHFVHDVLLGWLIGASLLWGLLVVWDKVEVWLAPQPLFRQIGWAFALSMFLVLAGSVAYLPLRDWPLPQAWLDNAALAGVEELPNPKTLNGLLSPSATLFGLLAGIAWLKTQGGFRAEGSWKHRILRYALGLLGIAVFWFGLGFVFPRGESILPYILRFVRYTLVGFWVSAGAPWVFIQLGLARRHL